jgi:hypothetical protein
MTLASSSSITIWFSDDVPRASRCQRLYSLKSVKRFHLETARGGATPSTAEEGGRDAREKKDRTKTENCGPSARAAPPAHSGTPAQAHSQWRNTQFGLPHRARATTRSVSPRATVILGLSWMTTSSVDCGNCGNKIKMAGRAGKKRKVRRALACPRAPSAFLR